MGVTLCNGSIPSDAALPWCYPRRHCAITVHGAHGLAAGHAIADYLGGKREDPSAWFVNSYPTFRVKRLLRFLFDRFQSDVLFNLFLHTRAIRTAASIIYFHHKGMFDPQTLQTDWVSRTRDSRLPR